MKPPKTGLTPGKFAVYLVWAFGFFSSISITLSEVFFILAAVAYGYAAVRDKTPLSRIFGHAPALPLAVFAAWHLLCALLGVDMAASLKDYKKIYIILAYFLAAGALKEKEDIIYAAALTVCGAAVAGLYAAGSTFYSRLVLGLADFRGESFSGGAMQAGGMFMMALVTAAGIIAYSVRGKGQKKLPTTLYFLAFLCILAGLLSTFTRGSWVAAAAGIAVVAWFADRKKRVFAATVAALLLAAFLARDTAVMQRLRNSFYVVPGTSQMERVLMWKAGAGIIRDNPVTGIGTANLEKVYPRYREPSAVEPNAGHLHNNLMQLAVIDGIPGALLLLWIFTALWYNLYIAAQRAVSNGAKRAIAVTSLAVSAGFFINGLFEYNFLSAQVALMFWLLMGMGAAAGKLTVDS